MSKCKQCTPIQANPGYQFEHLITGKGIFERSNWESTKRIHIMKVDKFTVLFMAEVDAVN